MFEINLTLSLKSVIVAVSKVLLLHLLILHFLIFSIIPPSRVDSLTHGSEIISEVSVVGALGLTFTR
jgi:hypothetical protein